MTLNSPVLVKFCFVSFYLFFYISEKDGFIILVIEKPEILMKKCAGTLFFDLRQDLLGMNISCS